MEEEFEEEEDVDSLFGFQSKEVVQLWGVLVESSFVCWWGIIKE